MQRVSVIVPCYNDGAYISEAIASIHAQTYSPLELIVIDDGSDDEDTIRVIEELEKEPDIKLIRTGHLGPSAARNAGIAAATGTYILPLDADDRIEPVYIEKAVETIESDPEAGIVYCRADMFGEKSGLWEGSIYSLDRMLVDNVVFITALFRKEDWESVGGFRETMKHGLEDYDFWLSLMELGRKVVQLPGVYFHYRIKPVSRTSQFMVSSEVVKETYRDIYRQHPRFYEMYRHEHALALRDALIDQIFINRALSKSFGVLERLKRITPLKKLIKKIIIK